MDWAHAMIITIAELTDLVVHSLKAAGMDESAYPVARAIVLTEQEGRNHNGLSKLRAYVDTLHSGWVDGRAKPIVTSSRPGIISVDAANGFAQPALEQVRDTVVDAVRSSGIALLALRNSHHYSALWPDVLAYAERGLVALAFLNSRSRLAPFGGRSKLFGSNPMAFACPRRDGPPVLWDQASSVISAMRVMAAAQRGETVPEGVGLDQAGEPTIEPERILDGGAQLPFGGYKGSMIALTVEIMAAALTGGRFGTEDDSHHYPGAKTSNAGQTIIVIDPAALSSDFQGRVSQLCSRLASNGSARVPGELRLAQILKPSDTVTIQDSDYQYALHVAGGLKDIERCNRP